MEIKAYGHDSITLGFATGENVVIGYGRFDETGRAELMKQGVLTLLHRAASGTRSKDEAKKEMARLQRAKELAEGRVLVDARERAAAEAARQTAVRIAQALLAQGLDVQAVAQATGLSVETVNRLTQE